MRNSKKILIVSLQGFNDIGANGSILRNLINANEPSTLEFIIFKQGIKGFKMISGDISIKEYSFLSDGNRIIKKLRLNEVYLLFQIPIVFFRMLVLMAKLRPDAIIGIYPSERLLVLSLIAAKFLHIKYFSWFHDLYSGTSVGFRKLISSYLEPFIIRQSTLNFAISKAVEKWYLLKYPSMKNWDVLPHPINFRHNTCYKSDNRKERITIFFSGTIYENCYDNLSLLLNVCKNFDFLNVTIITPNVNIAKKLITETKSSDFVNIDTKLSNADVYSEMMTADILFLPISFKDYFPADELNTMLPTKGIEYLFSNKLILVHVPKDSYVNEFMERYSGVVICNSDEHDEVKKALIECFRVIQRSDIFIRDMNYYNPINVKSYLIEKTNLC